jgi:mono/diheme cytochrome c family protein
LLATPATPGGGRRGAPLTPIEEKRLQHGNEIFGAVCFACHAADGMGAPLEGAAPGTMLAPALAGSPRVQAHRDYVIKVLLKGMTGPLDGKTYRDVMVPMDNTDEWIAGIASYVRTSFGNRGDMVTPADVARVRGETAGRKTPWTAAELEASLPHAIDSQQLKLTASHGADLAAGAASLRGWSSGVPQAPGMWFEAELPQTVLLTELQFDSTASPAGRGGRGAPQPAPGPAGRGAPAVAAARAVGYPRAYTVQLSVDGRKWSQPVAEGKGEGAHTTVTFAPTTARFVRITQTDTVAGAPPWSIRNLRLYEARATTP